MFSWQRVWGLLSFQVFLGYPLGDLRVDLTQLFFMESPNRIAWHLMSWTIRFTFFVFVCMDGILAPSILPHRTSLADAALAIYRTAIKLSVVCCFCVVIRCLSYCCFYFSVGVVFCCCCCCCCYPRCKVMCYDVCHLCPPLCRVVMGFVV